MKLSFWKSKQYWWVPILVLFLGAIGWIIQFKIEQSKGFGSITGNVHNIYEDVRVNLENTEYGIKNAKFPHGFFRFNAIHPGKHLLEFNQPGFEPIYEYIIVYGGIENEIITTFPEMNKFRYSEISELCEMIMESSSTFHSFKSIQDTSRIASYFPVAQYFSSVSDCGYTIVDKKILRQRIDSVILNSSDSFSLVLEEFSIRQIDTVYLNNSGVYFNFFVEDFNIGQSKFIRQNIRKNCVRRFYNENLIVGNLKLPTIYNEFNLRIDFYIRNIEFKEQSYKDDKIGEFKFTFNLNDLGEIIGPILSDEIPHYGKNNSSITFRINAK